MNQHLIVNPYHNLHQHHHHHHLISQSYSLQNVGVIQISVSNVECGCMCAGKNTRMCTKCVFVMSKTGYNLYTK
jgi:hypothetical protein